MSELNVDPQKGFCGTVSLTENFPCPNGEWVTCYYGYVRIYGADVVGMPPARGDTPWIAEVSGQNSTVWVPGCKVSAVSSYVPPQGATTWRVP